MERTGRISEKELGLLLINAGYLSQEEILANLKGYLTEIIRRLFTWVEGFFRFEGDMLPPDDRINVRLDLENIIIEGSRQLREWEQLQDEIPSLDKALKFTDRPLKNVSLSVEEQDNVAYYKTRVSKLQAYMASMDTIANRATVGHDALCYCALCEIKNRSRGAFQTDGGLALQQPHHN